MPTSSAPQVTGPEHSSAPLNMSGSVRSVASRSRRGRLPRWLPSPVLLAVIAGAWALAIAAELTGRAQWVHHHELIEGTLPLGATLVLFLVAWQAHIAAMMLPSSLPLIRLFRRASQDQPRPGMARGAFLGGYLVVWTIFGVLALAGDAVLHEVVHRRPFLDQPRLIGGGVLVVAGLFQFSELKDRCLRQCRHPAVFLMAHYERGVGPAWHLGIRHGVFCLGCCWALMLVMFVVGIANLAWMAPFALLMIYEKTGPGGDRAVGPIGIGLTALGALVALDPTWLSDLVGSAHHH
jgi:predicted metal-binding membrane protein